MMKDMAEIIKDLREDADLEQRKVADHLGISQQTYSTYECGKFEVPTRHLLPLARLYHVNVEYLLGATDYKSSLDSLKRPFTKDISLGHVVSDLISLDPEERKSALDYIEFLKTKRTAP